MTVDDPADVAEARRLVDVYLRPFHQQPFMVTDDVTQDDWYITIGFTYGSKQTMGYATVNRATREVSKKSS